LKNTNAGKRYIFVGHERVRCQWMRVPLEKLSIHLGSCLDSRGGRPLW
jgi:hypothetical protein